MANREREIMRIERLKLTKIELLEMLEDDEPDFVLKEVLKDLDALIAKKELAVKL